MRIRHSVPLIAIVCCTVAGCTTTSVGEPTAAPTSGSSTADSPPSSTGNEDDLPSAGAPKVEDPLEISRFEQDPCSTLTTDQIQNLNLPASGEEEEIPYGVGCTWRNSSTRGSASIGIINGTGTGLSGAYAANEEGKYSYFNPLPDIEGYPAVATDTHDRRSSGICIVLVGVTDQVAVQFSVRLSDANVGQKEPCEVAAEVAGMALQTMKDGA
jgi:hypothetical protein